MEAPTQQPHPVLDSPDIMRNVFDMLHIQSQLRFRLVCRSWWNIGYMTNCLTSQFDNPWSRFITTHRETLQRLTMLNDQMSLLKDLNLRELQIVPYYPKTVNPTDDDTDSDDNITDSDDNGIDDGDLDNTDNDYAITNLPYSNLEHLKTHTNLVRLNLSTGWTFTVNILPYLTPLTNLKCLSLYDVDLNVTSTIQSLKVPYLEEFEFNGLTINPIILMHMTGLKNLSLSYDNHGDDNQIMEKISRMTRLQKLTLYENNSFHMCDHLTGLTNLESFTTRQLDDGISTLNLMTRLTRLKHFDADCSDTVLQCLTGLNDLAIGAKLNSMNGIGHLSSSLTSLSINSEDSTGIHTFDLSSFSHLKSLKLIGPINCDNILNTVPWLTKLVLIAMDAMDASLMQLTHLRELTITFTETSTMITNNGIQPLTNLTRLEILYWTERPDMGISYDGLKHLTNLVYLDLQGVSIHRDQTSVWPKMETMFGDLLDFEIQDGYLV